MLLRNNMEINISNNSLINQFLKYFSLESSYTHQKLAFRKNNTNWFSRTLDMSVQKNCLSF